MDADRRAAPAAGRVPGRGEPRRLPYGANLLDPEEMHELREALEERVLYRYVTRGESAATRLERLAASSLGAAHALAVQNATQGLRVALAATRPRAGDLVYLPAVTFVAVAGAALTAGLIPVLVDVDERFRLDPSRLPAGAERVIVPHMDGTVSPLPAGVPHVIEDVAQAMGARHPDGRHAGTAGAAGVFSFHHAKVLTSGEGGLVVTGDPELHDRMRSYHDHGSQRPVHGEYPRWPDGAFFGDNCTVSELTAAVQLQQLRRLPDIVERLAHGYEVLRAALDGAGPVRVVERAPGDVRVTLRLAFETHAAREAALTRLQERRLPFWTLDRYFLPDHPVLRDRGSIYADGFPWSLRSGVLPVTGDFSATRERLRRVACLPISPVLTDVERGEEAEAYRSALGAGRSMQGVVG